MYIVYIIDIRKNYFEVELLECGVPTHRFEVFTQ
jgi:hypothetical protein